jgi:excisionase family DNA binding protein
MRDTRVTPPRNGTATTQPPNHHKIRIPGSDGTHHTNTPEILAPRPVQRAPWATVPPSAAVAPNQATERGEALTMAHKALYKVSEARTVLSLSRSVIYELIRTGRIRSVKEGAARLIPASAITEYVALLERESTGRAA